MNRSVDPGWRIPRVKDGSPDIGLYGGASDEVMDRPELRASVLAGPLLERDVRRVLEGLNLRLDVVPASGLLIARIESNCPELLIVDLDLAPCPEDLALFARSLRPDVRMIAAQWWWSEHEAPAFADSVLHKPARRDEWFPRIARIQLSIAHR